MREGIYKDGIFKFEMKIPPSYPARPPEVIFSTKVFHPLVDLNSGRLDISVFISNL